METPASNYEVTSNVGVPKSRMCGPQVRFRERGPRETGGPYSTWKSKVNDRTERKRSAIEACVPRVSRPAAVKPKVRRADVRTGAGVGRKFCVLTRRDLSASACGQPQAVATEDERTTWRRDERSRMVA